MDEIPSIWQEATNVQDFATCLITHCSAENLLEMCIILHNGERQFDIKFSL